MTADIFTALSTHIKTNVKDASGKNIFRTVELWNNQVEQWMSDDNKEKPKLLPACFIEFTDITEGGQNTQKVLHKDFKTVLHIVFESLKDNDVTYLNTKQQCYKYVQWFEYGTCSKFLWKTEVPNYDFTNLRWYQQVYQARLKDLDAVTSPNVGTVANITTTPSITNNI
jgi:hypothetical protein